MKSINCISTLKASMVVMFCISIISCDCILPGKPCETIDDCCPGSTCIHFSDDDITCAPNCMSDSECDSTCCAPVEDMNHGVCVDKSYCEEPECPGEGEPCETVDNCCAGYICVNFGDNNITCAATCTADSQCNSYCCAALENSDYNGACADASFCNSNCVAPGDKCNPGDCCPGSTCVWVDYVGAICQTQGECPPSCLVGSTCCRPPFCAGNCIGSPCCN